MVLGRWSCRAPLRHGRSPQNAIMKAHVLVGVLVVVGFAVGKGEWGPGAGREGVGRDLGVSSAPSLCLPQLLLLNSEPATSASWKTLLQDAFPAQRNAPSVARPHAW